MASVQDVINPITITNYERGFVDGISQHNPIFKLLMEKGNVKKNMHGTSLTWELKAGRHDVHVIDDDQDVSALYTPRKRFAQPSLSWGQLGSFRRLSKGQLRQNGGEQALVDFRDQEIPDMFKDMITAENGIGHQFLRQDGTSYSGTGLPLYGLPSLFYSSTAGGTNKKSVVTGSYAGLPMTLGAITVDGAEADAWTPTDIDTTASAWSAATKTFAANVFEQLTFAHSETDRFSASDPKLMADCFLLSKGMFQDMGTAIGAKQSIYLTGKVGKGEAFGMGSDQKVLYHDGLPVYWDENMPDDTGYCLNFDQIDLCQQPLFQISGDKSPFKKDGEYSPLFETEVTYTDDRRGVKVSVAFPGQIRFRNPRYQTRLYAH